MGRLFYNIFIFLYPIAIRIVSLWSPKAKLWINGRKNIFAELHSKLKTEDSEPVWMHCASLGEFEQGRPLLEELRARNEKIRIVLSFFSPSGYEVMKDYKGADHIFYLPMDSPSNARKFIDAIDPSLVLWVKYEYWFYYLDELKRRNIPVILVSGIFRKGQPFFSWYGGVWRKMLNCFTLFFVQNELSKELLESIHVNKPIMINGDTRFDRVIEIADKHEPVPFIDSFCSAGKVIVAGSTWDEDEVELLHYIKMHPEIKFIIAPHETDAENLADVKKIFPDSIFYSELEQTTKHKPQTSYVLIIDNVGMLSRLYRYADIAYVGGGFGGDGVHNVLEAAVYGKPVLFGPVYEKYDEALGLVESGGGIPVGGPLKLEAELNSLMTNEAECKRRGAAARDFVYSRAGATKKIMDLIYENRLLTNK